MHACTFKVSSIHFCHELFEHWILGLWVITTPLRLVAMVALRYGGLLTIKISHFRNFWTSPWIGSYGILSCRSQ